MVDFNGVDTNKAMLCIQLRESHGFTLLRAKILLQENQWDWNKTVQYIKDNRIASDNVRRAE